uniref:Uncharacterized protein n=1 Tax=Anopheles maculatus TaxID=74869 RepID=A0A182SN05_9DIPT
MRKTLWRDPPSCFADDDGCNQQQPSQFSINGIEIDLDELEQFEAKIRQKRSNQPMGQQSAKNAFRPGDDVQQREGHIDSNSAAAAAGCSSSSVQENGKDDLDLLYEEIQQKQALARANEEVEGRQRMASFLSVLLMFTTLLAFINQICYNTGDNQLLDDEPHIEEAGDDDDEENVENEEKQKDECSLSNNSGGGDAGGGGDAKEEEAEESCEESDEVSLAYLYNDNLEEDHEDWKSVESDYNNADEEFDSEDEEEEDGAENNDEGEDAGEDSDGDGEDEEDGGEEEEEGDADEDGNEENGAEGAP